MEFWDGAARAFSNNIIAVDRVSSNSCSSCPMIQHASAGIDFITCSSFVSVCNRDRASSFRSEDNSIKANIAWPLIQSGCRSVRSRIDFSKSASRSVDFKPCRTWWKKTFTFPLLEYELISSSPTHGFAFKSSSLGRMSRFAN